MATAVEHVSISKHPLTGKRRQVALCLVCFSLLYFVDVCVRASAKHFWYDELLTLYFSRLPLPTLWSALQTGLESNPPGFHLLTKAVEAIFGEGLIATRLPEILAFWWMSVCLFFFVRRRTGILGGTIALALPMLTGAYYYAYEARPLIIVAACAATALLFWDVGRRDVSRTKWLVAFSFTLLAAFMLHCYGILLIIPFAIVEGIRDLRLRHVRFSFWCALLIPLIPACVLYLPLLRAFSKFSKGTDFTITFPAVWPQVTLFYSQLLSPCIEILLASLILVAFDRWTPLASVTERKDRLSSERDEAIVTFGFLLLPAVGVLVAQTVHSPYFSRYFLAALLGICIPFAKLVTATGSRKWIQYLIAAVLALAICANLFRLLHHRLKGEGELLHEPSTGMVLETTPGNAFAMEPMIRDLRRSSLPIALLDPRDFLYISHYAPDLAPRLYFVRSSETSASLRGWRAFRPWSPFPVNPVLLIPAFVKVHPQFLAYSDVGQIQQLYHLAQYASIQSFKAVEGNFLATMEQRPAR